MSSDFEIDVSEETSLAMNWLSSIMFPSVVVAILVAVASWFMLNRDQKEGNGSAAKFPGNIASIPSVPFLVMEDPNWRELSVMLEKYKQDSSNLLKGLSQSLEVSLFSEREMGVSGEGTGFLFSKSIQAHLHRVSAALEYNENELLQLIQPFPVQFSLPQGEDNKKYEQDWPRQNSNNDDASAKNLFTMNQRYGASDPTKKNAYDCGAQVIAHVVRDWTALGKEVRSTTYDWCRSMVDKYVPRNALPILVPGAGLGRLAHDIAFLAGYAVEANEVSLSMAAGAHSILQQNQNGTIYPFAMDSFANEVKAERRYDRVAYPARPETSSANNGTLSFTIGDFVKVYRWQRPRGSFQCIVTCFFIDTATNIYEYLSTIEHALAPGGLWLNIGPLRWHHNSMLHPAADELKAMIEKSVFGFDVIQWSVDPQPSNYRQDDNEMDGFVRSTAYDGYRPLRFVVKRR